MARLKIVYDAVTGLPRQAEQWSNIQGKPEKYPPQDHTHAQKDVTGLEDALKGKAEKTHTHQLSDVTGLSEQNGKLYYNQKPVGCPPAVVSLVIPTDADNDNLTLTLQASEDGEFSEAPEGEAAEPAAEGGAEGAEAESKVATITMKDNHEKMKVFGSGKFSVCPESVGVPYYGSLLVIPIDEELIPGYEPGKRYFARYRWADKSTQAGEWRALIIQ